MLLAAVRSLVFVPSEPPILQTSPTKSSGVNTVMRSFRKSSTTPNNLNTSTDPQQGFQVIVGDSAPLSVDQPALSKHNYQSRPSTASLKVPTHQEVGEPLLDPVFSDSFSWMAELGEQWRDLIAAVYSQCCLQCR